MRPLIFDILFNDDRKYNMEISRVTVKGAPKWAVITRKNILDYPPFRSENFDAREYVLKYYFEAVPQTSIASLGSKCSVSQISIEEYKEWLKSNRLTDIYLDLK